MLMPPNPMPIITAAAIAASNTAMNAARIATSGRGGGTAPKKFASDAVQGEWEGVECCPNCLEPISEKEIWSNCCSKCGYTESVYIHAKTRPRRRVVNNGVEQWEWKNGEPIVARRRSDFTTMVLIAVGIVMLIIFFAIIRS